MGLHESFFKFVSFQLKIQDSRPAVAGNLFLHRIYINAQGSDVTGVPGLVIKSIPCVRVRSERYFDLSESGLVLSFTWGWGWG